MSRLTMAPADDQRERGRKTRETMGASEPRVRGRSLFDRAPSDGLCLAESEGRAPNRSGSERPKAFRQSGDVRVALFRVFLEAAQHHRVEARVDVRPPACWAMASVP